MAHPKFWSIQAREIERMQAILANNLPTCYDSFDDFLCDYWPDFSWTSQATLEQIDELEGCSEWLALADQVKAKYGYDFKQVLIDGRKELLELIELDE